MTARPTPFHARAAEHNAGNAWCERNGFTLVAHFGDAASEAIAARMSAVLVDISWRSRITLSGARAAECLSRLMTRDATRLAIEDAFKALWLNDAGAVRGAGVIVRYGPHDFAVISAADDHEWIKGAAALFDVAATVSTLDSAGIAIIGPYASHVLAAGELEPDLDVMSSRSRNWRGLNVTLSRFGEHGGYEVWCRNDDALIVWDRIVRTGQTFGLQLAGVDAMDTLDIEAGVPRPWRDYVPARDASGAGPTPRSLALESLMDSSHHGFNGYRSWAAARKAREADTLAGVVIDGTVPASFSALLADGRRVGRTLSSRYSPALHRAIALAELDAAFCAPGTLLSIAEPGSLTNEGGVRRIARVMALPFLPSPGSIAS